MAVSATVSACSAIADSGCAVVAQLADQLGGEVLGLGGAAAVAGDQQPAAAGQPVRQLRAPAGQQRLAAAGSGSSAAARRARWSSSTVAPVEQAWPAGHQATTRVGPAHRGHLAVDLGQPVGGAPPTSSACGPGPAPPWRTRSGGSGRRAAAGSRAPSACGSRAGTRSPVTPSTTVSDQPADGGADHRHAAGHRLQRGEPERLVPGGGDQHVGRAVPAAHLLPGHRADQAYPVGDPARVGQRAQPPGVRVGLQQPGRRAADHHALGVRAPAPAPGSRPGSPCARPAGRR